MSETQTNNTSNVSLRDKGSSSKEDSTPQDARKEKATIVQKGGKKPKTSVSTAQQKEVSKDAGSSAVGLSVSALGGIIAEALKSSFEGLKDSMNNGFSDLGQAIASQHGKGAISEDEDVSDDESFSSKDEAENHEDEPPTKKQKKGGGDKSNPLIEKLSKTLQFSELVGPEIDSDLASLIDKIMREKANDDKILELKKQHATPKNCTTLTETKVNTGVWNNLDESARLTDLKIQKVQKSLIKGITIIVSQVNKFVNDTEESKEDAVSTLMDGVLMLANANQELNLRRRELMRPQLNSSYRHLCNPSNPITGELFGDDLPKAVKDISDTNRLSSKLTKDHTHTRSSKGSHKNYGYGKNQHGYNGYNSNRNSKNYQNPLRFKKKTEGKTKKN